MKFNLDLGKVGITFGGEWVPGKDFERLTLVVHGGIIYLSLDDSRGVEPGTDPTKWVSLGGGAIDGGTTPGTVGSSDTIGVAYHSDGLLYWTRNGEWLLGPDGNMVRAQGIDGRDGVDGKDGQDATGGTGGSESGSSVARFKSIVFRRYNGTPTKPSGGTFDNPVPSGWSDGVPAGEARLWSSSRWFYEDDAMTASTDWTEPVVAGDSADIDYEWSAYENPGNPDTNPTYWHNDPRTGDLYWAVRVKRNGIWSNWDVVRIKGEKGAPGPQGGPGPKGDDGTSVKFSGRFDDPTDLPAEPAVGDGWFFDGTTFTDSNEKTWTNGHLFVWDGDSWEDVGEIKGPKGDDGLTPYIYVAFSDYADGHILSGSNQDGRAPAKYMALLITYEYTTRPVTAAAYSGCIWHKFTGDDGFGYEFIFQVNNSPVAPDCPSSVDQDEYVPTGWSDDPGTLNESARYLWMCYRKKQYGVWGNYIGNGDSGKASLFGYLATNGQDGVSPNTSFKSIVFKRTNETPDAPSANDGSYASPVPSGWSDGVPSGEARLWMSTRIFSSDGQSPQQSAWTTPQPVSDTADIDFEFSAVESNPGNPTDDPSNWHNDATDSDIWMAIRKKKNGVWGQWDVTKIKGEDGQDGTSISLKGTAASVNDLPASGNTEGDSYLIDGDLYVWDGDSWENAGRIQGPEGVGAYLHIKYANMVSGSLAFTGNNGEEPGDYIGLRADNTAADSSNINDYTWKYWKGQDGFGYEWIYKLTEGDTAPAMREVNAITTPAQGSTGQTAADDDFVPQGWTDDLVQPDANHPYAWKCYRQKVDGVWSPFKGTASDVAALEGRFYEQPNGIISVTEYYLKSPFPTGITPDEGDINPVEFLPDETHPNDDFRYNWSTNIPTLDARYKYLWNKEEVAYSNGDVVQTDPCVIGVYGIGSRVKSITEYYLATNHASGVTKNNGAWGNWSKNIQIISDNKRYLWNYEEIVYENEDSSDTTTFATQPVIIGHYGVDGNPGATGVGIDHVEEYYLASPLPAGVIVDANGDDGDLENQISWVLVSGTEGSIPVMDATNKYLWNFERVVYTNGDQVDTPPTIIGVFGEDGRGIASVDEYYLATMASTGVGKSNGNYGSWVKADGTHPVPTIDADHRYLWNREVINYTDGQSPTETEPALIGVYSSVGDDVEQMISDVDRLKSVFGEYSVDNREGALLRNLLGVTKEENEETVVKAILNASQIGEDQSHGKLVFASGLNGLGENSLRNATVKIYEDGYVELASNFKIGDFEYGDGGLSYVGQDNLIRTFFEKFGFTHHFQETDNGPEFSIKIGPGPSINGMSSPAMVITGRRNTQPLIKLTSLGEGPALHVENGTISFGDGGAFKGFRQNFLKVTNNNATVQSETLSQYHDIFVYGTGVTLNVPTPGQGLTIQEGTEHDIYAIKNATLQFGAAAAFIQLYGADGVIHSTSQSCNLVAGYRYHLVYMNEKWLISRNA